MITVITPAQSQDLTAVDVVKADLGIADRSEDENLERWITQASNVIAEYCNRVFAKEAVAETIRVAVPREDIVLARYPVTAVASVVENDVTLAPTDYELASDSGVLTRLSGDSPACWSGKIVIAYTGGYTLLQDLPYALERACIQLVSQYRNGAGRDPQLRSEAVEGLGSAGYFDGMEAGGLSPEVRGLLAPFRSFRV